MDFSVYLYTFDRDPFLLVYICVHKVCDIVVIFFLCRIGLRNRVLSSTCIRMFQFLNCIDVCLSLYAFESSTARHLSLLK